MTMTDPISDLLTRIRNAHLAKHDRLDVPSSKQKLEVCRLLKEQGFIIDYERRNEEKLGGEIRIMLRYDEDGLPAIRTMNRISKPGRRVYKGADDLRPVLNGIGVGIVSTSMGLLTDKQAREHRVGGELLCEIW